MHIHSRKHSSWFVTLPIAAAAIGYMWFVFFPTARLIHETHDEIREKQEFITQCETLHEMVAQLEQNLAESKQFTQQWRRVTPAAGQLSTLFGKISDQMRLSGVTATRFEPQLEVALQTMYRAPVQIELAGSWEQILQLLAAMERLPEGVWVDEVKLERSSETGKDVKGELKLEIFAGDFKKSG
jgi:Tfp pilus assembly protein PilO